MDNLFPVGECGCCGKPPFSEGENYVVTGDGCWMWTGPKEVQGYGRLAYRHIRWKAHRLSCLLTHSKLPDHQPLHHICENKACINPEHLTPMERGDHFNDHRSQDWYAGRTYSSREPEKVAAVKELHKRGYTGYQIGPMVGLSRGHVYRILKNN